MINFLLLFICAAIFNAIAALLLYFTFKSEVKKHIAITKSGKNVNKTETNEALKILEKQLKEYK